MPTMCRPFSVTITSRVPVPDPRRRLGYSTRSYVQVSRQNSAELASAECQEAGQKVRRLECLNALTFEPSNPEPETLLGTRHSALRLYGDVEQRQTQEVEQEGGADDV